jgi:hypothetical protein
MTHEGVREIITDPRIMGVTLFTGTFLGLALQAVTVVFAQNRYMPILLTSVAATVIIGLFLLLTKEGAIFS